MTNEAKPALLHQGGYLPLPIGEGTVYCTPDGSLMIDASLAFFDGAKIGDKLYTADQVCAAIDADRAARGAAQAAPVDATTWQPIATAPKDGKAILLRSKNGRIADGLWSAANSSTGFWAWAYVHQEPAEWMPKPGSPAARAQEQQP